MEKLVVWAADVGSIKRQRFGWCRVAADQSQLCGIDIQAFASGIVADLTAGFQVALGFECPFFVSIPADPRELTGARKGEGNRPWSAGAGAGALATGLTECIWVFEYLRAHTSLCRHQSMRGNKIASYTTNERAYLDAMQQRFLRLKALIATIDLHPNSSLGDFYQYITQMRLIQGNTSNDMSFIACLLAKQFLMARFEIGDFDVAEKPQGAPGLDIDLTTLDGKRIVAEIKTTVPYSGAKNDLGAAQKTTFRHDFEKLNRASADHKFFFVTDSMTLRIMEQRYVHLIPDVEVVLLTIG